MMMGKQTMFFTVKEDIIPIVKDWEDILEISYYKSGLFENELAPRFDSFFEVPSFATATAGEWGRLDNYLVMMKTSRINIERVPQRKGGVKYAVDPLLNPVSVAIKLGGIFKDNIIVAGRVGTVAQDEVSLMIYKTIASKIKKQCRRIGNFYVSKTAEKYMQEGWRLVTNEKLPTGFDLNM